MNQRPRPEPLESPLPGYIFCPECGGKRYCTWCGGDGYPDGEQCFMCSGSGRCGVCVGAGQLPEPSSSSHSPG